jgi:small subunit ribosomal protein S6
MARTYEATFILSPTLDDGGVEAQIAKIEEMIGREQGVAKAWDKWGKRRLAYEIKDQSDGYYAFLEFEAEPQAITPLQAAFRLDESILRHMIIVKDD